VSESVNYTKLIEEMLQDDKFNAVLPKQYTTVLKQVLTIPGMDDIFDLAIKNASSVKDDKMSLKKFYKKVRTLLIEMGKFYEWEKSLVVPNKNIWNEDEPRTCLPTAVGIFSNTNGSEADGSHEYFKIHDICHGVGTKLQNITVEDFRYLNKLHKKFIGAKND
jgi:hypothetical protein